LKKWEKTTKKKREINSLYFEYKKILHKDEEIEELSKKFNITKLTSELLLNKEFENTEEIEDYLSPEFTIKSNPKNILNIKGAAELFKEHIDSKNMIAIYGDYDADGVTSTAQLLRFLRDKNPNNKYFIPHREEEGYGLNKKILKKIINQGTKLLITVDCGITNNDEIAYVKENGVDVIVIDHHNKDKELPKADYIINPKIFDENSYFANLCGSGLTFKFIEYMISKYYSNDKINQYIQLSAIGTIADIVKLRGENRIIVRKGLKLINSQPITGINSIIKSLNKLTIDSGDISFKIAPMINSSGRMDHANNAVELMITKDEKKANMLASQLKDFNESRKDVEKDILKYAGEYIKKYCEEDKILVVKGENWHEGVIGIVSSKITEKLNKPSIVFTNNHEGLKASGRSIEGINLYEELKEYKKYFDKFGGHSQAVGLSMKYENFDIFKKEITESFGEKYTTVDLRKIVEIDAEIESENINIDSFEELKILEPFGYGNSRPKLRYKDFKIKSVKKIGRDKRHVKINTIKDGKEIELLYFDYKKEDLQTLMYYKDTVCSADINRFRGIVNPQFIIKYIKDYLYYEEKIIFINLLTNIETNKINIKNTIRLENNRIDITKKEIKDLKNYTEGQSTKINNKIIIHAVNNWIPKENEYNEIKQLILNSKSKIGKTNIFKIVKHLNKKNLNMNPEKILFTLSKEQSNKLIKYRISNNNIFIRKI